MLALVAVVVWPRVRVARMLAAEDRVMDKLASLAKEIAAFQSLGSRDADGDGHGEVGTLREVMDEQGHPKAYLDIVPGTDVWAPTRAGYYIALFVPGPDRRPAPAGGDDVPADHAETMWVLAAWPTEPGRTGMRAYLRTPGDGILRDAVDGYPYGGADRAPVPDVALLSSTPQGLRPEKLRGKRWVSPREQRGKAR